MLKSLWCTFGDVWRAAKEQLAVTSNPAHLLYLFVCAEPFPALASSINSRSWNKCKSYMKIVSPMKKSSRIGQQFIGISSTQHRLLCTLCGWSISVASYLISIFLLVISAMRLRLSLVVILPSHYIYFCYTLLFGSYAFECSGIFLRICMSFYQR